MAGGAPIRSQAAIDARIPPEAAAGAVRGHGRVLGGCGGIILVEAADEDGRVLARAEASGGRYALGPMQSAPAQLRWGCDEDGDGVVLADAVADSPIGRVPLTGAVLVLPIP